MKIHVWIFLLMSSMVYSQTPIVYSLQWYQPTRDMKPVHFVSLSDRYWLKEHEDSLAIPDQYLDERRGPAPTYIPLKGTYRERCLKATGISENDVVYVYDYAEDKLLRFYVRGLKLIGVMNIYDYGDDYPISQYHYMIGFEIEGHYLKHFSQYHNHVLVSIGRQNPFNRGLVKPVKWQQVDSTLFPGTDSLIQQHEWLKKRQPGMTHRYRLEGLDYFVQDVLNNGGLGARHVAVINRSTGQLLFEKLYIDSEGGSPAPLNVIDPIYKGHDKIQFAGRLFKNQPPVIFGLMYQSFGCPGIDFIDPHKKGIYIHCDNRH